MKKAILTLFLFSLAFSSFAAEMNPSCQKYFKAIDDYLEMAGKNVAMKAQLDAMKGQYEQSKQQISSLPAESQEQACKPALASIEQAMTQLKVMQ